MSPLTHRHARSPLQQSASFPSGFGFRMVLRSSSELFVRVVDMENVMNQQKLEGYTSAIRAVSWDPSGNILVSVYLDPEYRRVLNFYSDDVYARREDCDLGYGPVSTEEGEGP